MSSAKRRTQKAAPPPAPKRPAWLIPAVLVAVGAALVAVALWLVQSSQQQPFTPKVTGQPSAEIDQTVFDYGSVRINTPVETVIRVRNVGDQPLTLQEPLVELIQGC